MYDIGLRKKNSIISYKEFMGNMGHAGGGRRNVYCVMGS